MPCFSSSKRHRTSDTTRMDMDSMIRVGSTGRSYNALLPDLDAELSRRRSDGAMLQITVNSNAGCRRDVSCNFERFGHRGRPGKVLSLLDWQRARPPTPLRPYPPNFPGCRLTFDSSVASAFRPSSSLAPTHISSGTSIGSTGATCLLWRSVSSTPTRTSGRRTSPLGMVTRYVSSRTWTQPICRGLLS